MKHVLFIYNRHAGKNKTWANLSDMINTMTEQDCLITAYPTQYRGDAGDAIVGGAAHLTRSWWPEGTVPSAKPSPAPPAAEPPVIGYIPVGTTNDFSKNLDLPLDKLTELAATAVTRRAPHP